MTKEKINLKNAPNPWTNLIVGQSASGEITVELWGRTYVMNKSLLFTRIISQGKDLLTSPIRIIGRENGKEFVFSDAECFVVQKSGSQAVISSAARSDNFILNASLEIAFDGLVNIDIKLMPVGLTVNQVFGVEKYNKRDFYIDKLWVEIPIDSKIATNFHYWPIYWASQSATFESNPIPFSNLCMSRELPSSMAMGFKALAYLGNQECGLGYYAQSDQNWQYEENRAIEFVKKEDEVIMRLRLLDSHPKKWIEQPDNPRFLKAYAYLPLTFSFGLQATPVKPFPKNPFQEKSVHIDCFKKIKSDYYDFLLNESDDPNYACNLDKIKDCGVTILYLHEKWNKLQNSWLVPYEDREKIKKIIDECHRRGIKVIPYFGYEISTLSPLWAEMSDKVLQTVPGVYRNGGGWYRKPEQRDYVVCYNSGWQDAMLEGLQDLFDEFDFDGIYLDSTLYPAPCSAPHGCGYVDENGVKITYPVLAIRNFMIRLYDMMKKRGKIISAHLSNCINIPSIGFCDVIWDGEAIQSYIHENGIDKIPLGYMRTEYVGRNLGVLYEFLVYTFDNWSFEDGLSLSLIHGILPKPNDIGKPLEIMKKIWQIFDSFPICNSEFRPYWQDSDIVNSDNKDVKCSLYEYKGYDGARSCLLIASNPTSKKAEANLKINFVKTRVFDALDNKTVNVEDNNIKLRLDRCGIKIYLINEII